jgi:uroporphyrinogen decarboxylase
LNKPTPDFNRFKVAVTRERLPDRLPIAEVEVDPPVMEAYLGRPITSVQDHVDFWEAAGYDFTIAMVRGQPLPDVPFQPVIGDEDHPYRATGDRDAADFRWTGIADWEAFENYPWIGPEKVYYKDVDAIGKCLPDGMKLVVNHGPLFSGLMRAMRLENLSIAQFENPELIAAIVKKMGDLALEIVENALQRDFVGALWFGDDIAYTGGLMVSPAFLRQYIFPYYKKIGETCRKHGKPYIFHSDGDLTQVYDDIIGAGVQAIHPNEPTSVDISEIKRNYGDRIGLIGNVDVGLLTLGQPEEIAQVTRELIESVGPGGGFALGSGNSVARYVKFENYMAMVNTAKEFGNIY